MVKDPVCGMDVDPKKSVSATKEGREYYFCSDSCMNKFISMKSKTGLNIPAVPLIISIVIIIAVTFLYFFVDGLGNSLMMGPMKVDPGFYENINLKVAFADNQMKLFARADNNKISMFRTMEGNPIPEDNSMVIGYGEAMMMQSERLFEKPGDRLSDFFGISTNIEGVLRPTGQMIDYMHFLSRKQYEVIKAEPWVAFVRFTENREPKLFYQLKPEETFLNNAEFESGSITEFKMKKFEEETYYPVILGFKEAEMMRSEKLFSASGDKIKGFFGKNIFIAGVLSETNTSLDVVHFTPLGFREI